MPVVAPAFTRGCRALGDNGVEVALYSVHDHGQVAATPGLADEKEAFIAQASGVMGPIERDVLDLVDVNSAAGNVLDIPKLPCEIPNPHG
jgi:hypothetical protein